MPTSALSRMARLLAHRGPDDARVRVIDRCGFAFTRLTLLDPELGAQPFVDDSGRVMIMANGEIYNYRDLRAAMPTTRFRSDSDCEVLLPLYLRDGLDLLSRVRGMFSVVIYDDRTRELHLARDRFGIKPLFYTVQGDVVAFGSEVKALAAAPGVRVRFDWGSALRSDSVTGAVAMHERAPERWFTDVHQVAPGTSVTINLSDQSVRVRPFDNSRLIDLPTEEAYVAAYRDLLAASVAECLHTEAEVGLFLSGGIDSAAVAALAAPHRELTTYTVVSESTVATGDVQAAARLAADLGLAHHPVMTVRGDIPTPQSWLAHLWHLESPVCGAEQIMKQRLHQFARRRDPRLKAMLLGQASDEFNGGYLTSITPGGTWADFAEVLQGFAGATLGRLHPDLSAHCGSDGVLRRDGVLDRLDLTRAGDAYPRFVDWKSHDVHQYNCWHEDRMAAANGVEGRVPFLHDDLVDLCLSVPPHLRPALFTDKAILRRAMRGIVPDWMLDRPKGPFYHGAHGVHAHQLVADMLLQDDAALVDLACAGDGGDVLDRDRVLARIRGGSWRADGSTMEILLIHVNLGLLHHLCEADLTAARAIDPLAEDVVVLATADRLAGIEGRIAAQVAVKPLPPRLSPAARLLQDACVPESLVIAVAGEVVIDLDDASDETTGAVRALFTSGWSPDLSFSTDERDLLLSTGVLVQESRYAA